tara:strand:- start:172 stop:909 length:738 start_codon:yes stop_codon:yes gene_type:complete
LPLHRPLEVHDIAELVTWDLPAPEFYINDILPKQGSMLVYGSPKVKKSWLVQYMGFSIATGQRWLEIETGQARVLMAQFEIGYFSYAGRLRLMHSRHFTAVPTGYYYEVSPGLMYLDEDENFNEFLAAITPFNPDILVLDCMSACFGGDENNGESMARFLERLEYLKILFNCSIILVHHTNKNLLSTSSVDRVRGHSRLTGYVDTLMYMAEQPNDGVQLQIKSRQAVNDPQPVNIAFNNYQWLRR